MDLLYPFLKNLCITVPNIPPRCFDLHPRIYANRDEALSFWPEGATYCEVGVAYGEFTEKVISQCKPSHVHLVDRFDIPINANYWNKTYLKDSGLSHLSYIVKKFPDRDYVSIWPGDSYYTLRQLPDDSLDICYIDGDHTYGGVLKDLLVAKNKVRDQGLLIFNDYTFFSAMERYGYGVYRAVNEFLNNEPQHRVAYYALGQDHMDDIAIQIYKERS